MTTQTPSDGPQTTSTREEATPTPKKRGRPRKADVEKYKKGNRGVRGRPKGDAARMNEFKARVLASPKSEKVLESIFNAALDDEHKGQQAAWKLIVDRILPVGAFEKEVIKDAGRSAIQINISGVGTAEVTDTQGNSGEEDYIDGEYSES
jgi:hypothetical protein